jgi:hypothetical protein
MKVEGYTAKEMAEILEITYTNVRHRISILGIEPLTKDAIYPSDTLDKITKFGLVGRPRKAAAPEVTSKNKKTK